jgi:hypothetical protein
MNGEAKISSAHRNRLAVIYLRQSSMAQVRCHTESTTRQYGLADEAVRLGAEHPAHEPIQDRPKQHPTIIHDRSAHEERRSRHCIEFSSPTGVR